MNYGKAGEPSSSPNPCPSTARYAATSAILMVTLLKSDRAPTSCTVDPVPEGPRILKPCGTPLSTTHGREPAGGRPWLAEQSDLRRTRRFEQILGRRGRRDGLE